MFSMTTFEHKPLAIKMPVDFTTGSPTVLAAMFASVVVLAVWFGATGDLVVYFRCQRATGLLVLRRATYNVDTTCGATFAEFICRPQLRTKKK